MVKRAFFLVLVLSLATVVRCGGDSGGDSDTTQPTDTVGTDTAGTDTTGTDTTVKPDGETPETACTPDCDGKVCGDDGCEGTCGACAGTCSDDQSECIVCEPACDGKACGDDGCGGSCGSCTGTDTCNAGVCEPCVPACDGKVCGDDGCEGSCGTCGANEVCNATQTACEGVSFGKASHFNALYIPGTADEAYAGADFTNIGGSVCLDINGDGTIDNGLGALLGTLQGFGVDANGEILKLFQEGTTNILLDLGADPEAAPFDLNGYLGDPGAAAGEYTVNADSFVDGEPMIHFAGAELSGGKMELGPITFPLGALLAGFLADAGIPPLDITLDKVQLVGTVDGAIDDMGVAFKDGTLAGAIFKADLDKALYLARKWCAEDPEAPADICGYLQMADMSLIETFLTWDQDIDGCGKKLQVYDANDPMVVVGEEDNCQAVSACIFWGSDKAKITGLTPAE